MLCFFNRIAILRPTVLAVDLLDPSYKLLTGESLALAGELACLPGLLLLVLGPSQYSNLGLSHCFLPVFLFSSSLFLSPLLPFVVLTY